MTPGNHVLSSDRTSARPVSFLIRIGSDAAIKTLLSDAACVRTQDAGSRDHFLLMHAASRRRSCPSLQSVLNYLRAVPIPAALALV